MKTKTNLYEYVFIDVKVTVVGKNDQILITAGYGWWTYDWLYVWKEFQGHFYFNYANETCFRLLKFTRMTKESNCNKSLSLRLYLHRKLVLI